MTVQFFQLLLVLLLQTPLLTSFQIGLHKRARINRGDDRISLGVIKADEADFKFDVGAGGVSLAMDSIVKIAGSVKHKPGNAESMLKDLIRYTSLTELKESTVLSSLDKIGATIVCTGAGNENYKDPGQETDAIIVLAPMDAVRDALTAAGSAMNAALIILNFAGGDDAQVLEVLDAAKQMVLMLDMNTKAKVQFNSISASQFPQGSSSITVIAIPEGSSTESFQAEEKAITMGEVYFCQGKYWTLIDDNINPALE